MTATLAGKQVKLAVISDLHFGTDHAESRRRCSIACILLERAVRRLNKLIQPDVVLILGDVVDDGSAPETVERLQAMRAVLDQLEAAYLAIPGNHDGDVDQFYSVFDRPPEIVDLAGVRFLPFIDREEPGFNATRSAVDMRRPGRARAGWDGPLVTLQHVCLFPPEQDCAPYNYTNAETVIAGLEKAGVSLSVSGHHHHGADDSRRGRVTFVNAPGLCESPFPLLEIVLDGESVETRLHELVMPKKLGLTDQHMHTELAYCSQDMQVETNVALAQEFGLAGITLTEHAGQLYYERKAYWRNEWLPGGIQDVDPEFARMADYLALKEKYECDYTRFSLEADCDARGNLVLKPEDRRQFDQLLGTIHALSGFGKDTPPTQHHVDEFLFLVDAMGKQGIRALAHPLRIFGRCGWETPPQLLEPTARLLAEHEVAAEINFHANQPQVEFIRHCLHYEVKFTFGSDAHQLSEIGDFAYHIALLRQAGFDGDLNDIFLS